MRFGLAASFLERVTVRTPFLNSALMLASSMMAGIEKDRLNTAHTDARCARSAPSVSRLRIAGRPSKSGRCFPAGYPRIVDRPPAIRLSGQWRPRFLRYRRAEPKPKHRQALRSANRGPCRQTGGSFPVAVDSTHGRESNERHCLSSPIHPLSKDVFNSFQIFV